MTKPPETMQPPRLRAIEEHVDRTTGLAIAVLREHAEMTTAELAVRTGIPIDELEDLERGEIPLTVLRGIIMAEALAMSPHAWVRLIRWMREQALARHAAHATNRLS